MTVPAALSFRDASSPQNKGWKLAGHLFINGSWLVIYSSRNSIISFPSDRNKGQKLVGRFLKNWTFCRLLIADPLKMYSKFD